jgi:hypothetical protein
MKEIKLTVDVKCNDSTKSPIYRVYVDEDLITERTFMWDHNTTFIREHIFLALEPGEHTVKVTMPFVEQVYASASNIQVIGHPFKMAATDIFVLE